MKRWLTADLHLAHTNIIKYCNRPFSSIEEMNETIINNWNKLVGPRDTVYCLGDFCFRGKTMARKFEEILNGKIIHISGNHDYNNGVVGLEFAAMRFSGLEAFMTHEPPLEMKPAIPEFCDLYLCGHVHQLWKHKIYPVAPDVLILNVGVDVWNFKPIDLDQIHHEYYHQLLKKK